MCSRVDTKHPRNTIKSYLAYVIGIFFVYTAFAFVMFQQSSINIKDGLGTISLACSYISSIVFGLIFTPILIRRFGVKKCILLSEATYATYIISNYYPEYYTMLPGALLLGAGEATLWPCITMMNVYYGRQYSDRIKNRNKSYEYYVGLFSGYYFAIHHCNKVICGLISFFTQNLFHDQFDERKNLTSNSTKIIFHQNETHEVFQNMFQHCGANDCQDVEVVEETIEKYTPTDNIKLIILISFLLLICLLPIIVHVIVLPNVTTHALTLPTTVAEVEALEICSDGNLDDSDFMKEAEFVHVRKKSVEAAEKPSVKFSQISATTISEKIGFYVAVFGAGHAISAYMFNKTRRKIGQTFLFLICVSLDLLNLIFCLHWNPNQENSWMVYIVYLCFGLTDGIWQPGINMLYVEYFPDNQYIAGSVWTVLIHVGMGIQFAWSGSFCVSTKIYILIGLLIIGFILYCVAEYFHIRKADQSRNK
uniref:protein unc-93 homolog A-like isoform X2 n=1 Tax=Styela clava TaxID=7725 RepID=UPI0019398064|nr:protein unc-93 homolog A-like isoform X2 [Styela clava]